MPNIVSPLRKCRKGLTCNIPAMKTPQLPNSTEPSIQPESSPQPEPFFPKAHPRASWAMVLAAVAVCWAALFWPSPVGKEVALELFSPLITLIFFYLICWWQAGEDKARVRGLAVHASMLAVAEFVVWGLFGLGQYGETAEMVLVFINFVAYAILSRVLYGFSPLRSLGVMGLMVLAFLVCVVVFILLALMLRSPALLP